MLKIIDSKPVKQGSSIHHDVITTEKGKYKSYHMIDFKTHEDTGNRTIYLYGSGVCIGNTLTSGKSVDDIINEFENGPQFKMFD